MDRNGACKKGVSVVVKVTDTCPCQYAANYYSNKVGPGLLRPPDRPDQHRPGAGSGAGQCQCQRPRPGKLQLPKPIGSQPPVAMERAPRENRAAAAAGPAPPQRWCCGDKRHMDLSWSAFDKIADRSKGVVPIRFRKVCARPGGGAEAGAASGWGTAGSWGL
jgi:hypothetical protein